MSSNSSDTTDSTKASKASLQPRTRPRAESGDTSWSLDNSALFWWTELDFWKHPGNVLLISSIPFCAGAYFGFKKPSEKLERLAGADTASANETATKDKAFGSLSERRSLGVRTAGRALRLATLGSLGTFGILGAAGFYIGGYETLDSFLMSTRNWAFRYREAFENWLDFADRPSKTHPEVLSTRNMSEEEEMEYIYSNYIKEPNEEEQVASQQQGGDPS